MPAPHGEPPSPEIPPETLAVAADLRWLTRRADGEERREASAGRPLPPLLAALTRRPEDDEGLRRPRLPVTPRRGSPTPPRPPDPLLRHGEAAGSSAIRTSRSRAPVAEPRTPPGHGFAEGATLRPYPPLCRDAAAGDAEAEPLDVRELYRELSEALPAERLRFHREPLVEPAAAAADLLPAGPRDAGETPRRELSRRGRRQNVCLFDDYLRYVAATGSDFLHAIFHLRRGEEGAAGAPQPRREPAPAPAQPYERGMWKPVLPEPAPAGSERLWRRLHRLWAALGVPGWERLQMAVKYGAGATPGRLPAALEAWEAAAAAVARREMLLARSERLEEGGSEPGRFFRGAAAKARGEEGRRRGRSRAALARCEARLSVALRRLRDGFGDAVTFRGRPYAEKMRRDAVEMLYRLQQRRRAAALLDALGGSRRRCPPGPARAETPGAQ